MVGHFGFAHERKIRLSSLPAQPAGFGEIIRRKLIRCFSAPLVCFRGRRQDQCTVGIKSAKKTVFIRLHVRLHKSKRIFIDEKRQLYCAVMPPEMNGTPGAVENSAFIREFKHVSPRRLSLDARNPAFS